MILDPIFATRFIGRCYVCGEKHEPRCIGSDDIAKQRTRDLRHQFSRADMVRVVVAQQWAVACALHSGLQWHGNFATGIEPSGWSDRCGGMPCADDVVAELLGER